MCICGSFILLYYETWHLDILHYNSYFWSAGVICDEKCSYSFSVINYICKNELHMQYSQLDYILSLIYCCKPQNHFEYLCMHGKKDALVNADLIIHWVKTSGKEITVCAELHCLRFIFFFVLYASEALWNNLISIQWPILDDWITTKKTKSFHAKLTVSCK